MGSLAGNDDSSLDFTLVLKGDKQGLFREQGAKPLRPFSNADEVSAKIFLKPQLFDLGNIRQPIKVEMADRRASRIQIHNGKGGAAHQMGAFRGNSSNNAMGEAGLTAPQLAFQGYHTTG